MCGIKEQVMNIFKAEDYSKPKRVRIVYGNGEKLNKLKIQKQKKRYEYLNEIKPFSRDIIFDPQKCRI